MYSFGQFSPHESSSNSYTLLLLHYLFHTWAQLHNQTFCYLPLEIQGSIYRSIFVFNFSFCHDFLLKLRSYFSYKVQFSPSRFQKKQRICLVSENLLSTSVSALLVTTKCKYKSKKNLTKQTKVHMHHLQKLSNNSESFGAFVHRK